MNEKMKAKKLFSLLIWGMGFSVIILFLKVDSQALELSGLDHANYAMHVNGESHDFQSPPSGRFGDTPEDSATCVRNISLYTEYYNQRNFNLAYDFWREVFFECPKAQQNTFIRGAVLLKMKYNEETDPVKREAWVDTLMLLYDKRIEHFGHTTTSSKGSVLGKKAVDLFQFRPDNLMEINELTTESIELQGKKSQADVILVHMNSLTKLVQAGLKESEDVLQAYSELMEIVDYNIENNPKDAERFYKPAKKNIENMFEPYATCDNIVSIYEPKFEENPEDIELLEKVTAMLSKSDCTSEDLFYKTTRNLHELKPTAESAFLMGRLENNAENYEKAINYFQQAVELYEDDKDKINTYMRMAEISYRALKEYPQARRFALEASSLDPEDGRPYILIGQMYASTASACGDNELTKAVGYWAAVDKFIQARNVENDPDIIDRANKLISTYRKYFPDKETAFFYGLTEGDTYQIEDCWINETTRVRF
ncbi:MAG: tetratricopeptide repeat protein [Bacteroidota bacterium]